MLSFPPFDIRKPGYNDFRRLLKTLGVEIIDQEPDHGLLGFVWHRNYSVFVEDDETHCVHVPISFHNPTKQCHRQKFDVAFENVQDRMTDLHGIPITVDYFLPPNRGSDKYFRFAVWRFNIAEWL